MTSGGSSADQSPSNTMPLVIVVCCLGVLAIPAEFLGDWRWIRFAAPFLLVGGLGLVERLRRDRSWNFWLQMQSGEFEEAEAEVRRLIESDPNDADLRCHHGLVLVYLKRFDEAAEAFERAEKGAAKPAAMRVNRGYALSLSGRWAEAEPLLRESADDAELSMVVSYHLANLYVRQGRTGEAWHWWNRAEAEHAELGPEDIPMAQADRLQTLELLLESGPQPAESHMPPTDASGRP